MIYFSVLNAAQVAMKHSRPGPKDKWGQSNILIAVVLIVGVIPRFLAMLEHPLLAAADKRSSRANNLCVCGIPFLLN